MEFLQTLARNLNLPVPEPGKSGRGRAQLLREKLCKDLISFYSQPSHLEGLWQGLEPEARYMLELVLFGSGAQGLEVHKAHGRLNNLWGRDVTRQVRDKLLGLGLLFLSSTFRQEHYQIPAELSGFLYYKKVQSLIEPLRQGAEPGENHGKFLLVDFYVLLACVLQWRIKVAQAGYIYKKDRKKIASLLHYPENEKRYELLENLAWKLGFLKKEGENEVKLTKKAWEWLELHPVWQWHQFVTQILERELSSTEHKWLEHILNLVLVLPPGRWMSLANLQRLISDFSLGQWRQFIIQEAQNCLQRLLWAGLLEVRGNWDRGAIRPTSLLLLYLRLSRLFNSEGEEKSKARNEEDFAQLAPEVEESFPKVETFVVQPNFEILAPLEINPLLFMRLSAFAELESADRMFIFRLSHRSFYRGFMSGWSPQDMVELINKHSKYELPPNVRSSLEEWSGKMGRVYLERGVLVRCTEELSGEVKAFLQRQGWLVDQISPTAYLVPEEVAGICLKLLEAEGFFPRPQVVEHRANLGSGVYRGVGEDILGAWLRDIILEELRKK